MLRLSRTGVVVLALACSTARAQPTADPGAAPLAQIKDDRELTEALSAITQDPAILVNDPATRALAQALMIEGVKQLQDRSYDQALANFLEAYNKFPSPRILMNVASTLRDMGRIADAANTYQRYLADPATGSERVAEVKELLLKLDEQLTILTVRVFPRSSEISIDAGPFIPVGSSLLTRVRPGLHLVRIRKLDEANELTVNGFEGENKEVAAAIQVTVTPDVVPPEPNVPAAVTDHVDGWLITGQQYAAGAGNSRKPRAGFSGPEIAAIVPHYEATASGDAIVDDHAAEPISSGVLAVLRIDGKGRGFAGGFGFAISGAHLEAELMFLKSDATGGYLGARYRLLTGLFRPYGGLGMPGFVYDQVEMGTTTKKLAVGVRAAIGVELKVNGHLSVQGDLGWEHFLNVGDTNFETDVFVPTLGVIGRL